MIAVSRSFLFLPEDTFRGRQMRKIGGEIGRACSGTKGALSYTALGYARQVLWCWTVLRGTGTWALADAQERSPTNDFPGGALLISSHGSIMRDAHQVVRLYIEGIECKGVEPTPSLLPSFPSSLHPRSSSSHCSKWRPRQKSTMIRRMCRLSLPTSTLRKREVWGRLSVRSRDSSRTGISP